LQYPKINPRPDERQRTETISKRSILIEEFPHANSDAGFYNVIARNGEKTALMPRFEVAEAEAMRRRFPARDSCHKLLFTTGE
jgi:hypothetical protein